MKNADVRKTAASALGKIGDPRAVESLKVSFEVDKRIEVQIAAREALKRISGSAALGKLRAALQSKDPDIRWRGIIAALESDGKSARLMAVIELGDLRDLRAVEPSRIHRILSGIPS